MSEQCFDVLIAGAGMVGAALACALGSQGLTVAVFDQAQPEPFQAQLPPDLRVSALSHASWQLLSQLGVWPWITAMRLCPYRKMAVWEKLPAFSRANQVVFDAAAIGHEQLGFIVENRVTRLALHRAMGQHDSVQLFCPAVIASIRLDGAQPLITLEDGRRFRGQLLVGADGARSRVRQAGGFGLSSRDYGQRCLVATVEIAAGAQDTTWQAFTPTGPEAFLPLPDINGKSYASIVWYNRPEAIRRLQALEAADFLATLAGQFPQELPPLIRLHQRGDFALTRRHVQSYYRNGLVLVGDAAHTINPLAGQGVNLGFLDVAWLAQVLVDARRAGKDIASPTVLARYQAMRQPDNQRMMTLMDLFYHTFSNDHLPLKLARNLGLVLAARLPLALGQVMNYAMGLSGNLPRLARGQPL